MPTTTLDLLRHGQTALTKRFGFPNEPLAEEGRNQMWRAVGSVFPWRMIFTSPYGRCAEFAHALGERTRLPVVELAELRPLDWGSWTDKERDDVMRTDPDALARFNADSFTHRVSGGESLADVANRSAQACLAILEQAADQHVLVVGHKWNIQAIIARALQMPARSASSIACQYASLTRLEFNGSGSRYLTHLAFHTGGTPRVPRL